MVGLAGCRRTRAVFLVEVLQRGLVVVFQPDGHHLAVVRVLVRFMMTISPSLTIASIMECTGDFQGKQLADFLARGSRLRAISTVLSGSKYEPRMGRHGIGRLAPIRPMRGMSSTRWLPR